MSPHRPRERTEWITFGISVAVLLAVVVAIAIVWAGGESPAAPTATIKAARHVDQGYAVDVTVGNDGDVTAANVQVVATLTIGAEVTEAEQVVDFVAGGEEMPLVFRFTDDPAQGYLEVVVASFADP